MVLFFFFFVISKHRFTIRDKKEHLLIKYGGNRYAAEKVWVSN